MKVHVHESATKKAQLRLLQKQLKQAEAHLITPDQNKLTKRDGVVIEHWNTVRKWAILKIGWGGFVAVWAVSPKTLRLYHNVRLRYQVQGLMYVGEKIEIGPKCCHCCGGSIHAS